MQACKFNAITITRREKQPQKGLSEYKGVWVFAEQRNGVISSVVFELLNKARELAKDLNTYVGAVLLGHNIKAKAQELIQRGAQKVILADMPQFKEYIAENYTNAIVNLIKKYKPEIFLAGATSCGRSLVSRIAVNLYTGLTADCTGLDIDPREKILIQTRPAFGGNIMAQIISPDYRPQMATVRHKVMPEAPLNPAAKGEIIEEKLDTQIIDSRVKFIKFVEEI